MKIKTENLVGKQLNYAVAVSEGFKPFTDGISWIIDCKGTYKVLPGYSTDWAVAGPIIEREQLDIEWVTASLCRASYEWLDEDFFESFGPTPLIAAMRSYVASKLGEEVEIPEELL